MAGPASLGQPSEPPPSMSMMTPVVPAPGAKPASEQKPATCTCVWDDNAKKYVRWGVEAGCGLGSLGCLIGGSYGLAAGAAGAAGTVSAFSTGAGCCGSTVLATKKVLEWIDPRLALAKANQAMQKQMADLQEENKRFKVNVSTFSDMVGKVSTLLAQIKDQRAAFEQKFTSSVAQLGSQETEHAGLLGAVDQIIAEQEALQTRLDELDPLVAQVEKLTKENTGASKQLDTAAVHLETAAAASASATGVMVQGVAEHKKATDAMKKVQEILTSRIQAFEGANGKLETTIAELRAQLEKLTQQKSKAEADLGIFQKAKADLEAKVAEIQSAIAAVGVKMEDIAAVRELIDKMGGPERAAKILKGQKP